MKNNFKDWILYEDDHLLVVNKPPLLSSLTDRNDDYNLLAIAKDYCPDAQLAHRLDKETSGALIIAKTPPTYKMLSEQFERRQIKKTYHAVSNGLHSFNQLTEKAPILPTGQGTAKIDLRKGKPSQTIFNTIDAYKANTLIACQPITGRLHQIRVHLALNKAPICNDGTYHGKPIYLSEIKKRFNLKRDTDEQPLIKRMALHAQKIVFNAPGQLQLTVEAPYPKDFQVLIKQLDKNRY